MQQVKQRSRFKFWLVKNSNSLIAFAVLAAIVIAGSRCSPRFLSKLNIGNLMEQTAGLALVAIGQSLVILTGGIDLSIGAMVSVGCAVMSVTMADGLVAMALSVLLICGIGFAAGVMNGVGISKLRIPPFAMTLAMMMVLNGVALKIRPTPGGYIPYDFCRAFLQRIGGTVPVAFVLAVGAYVLMIVVLSSTRFGRNVYAIGGSERTAALSGIKTNRTKVAVYALSSIFAAVGSVVITARMGTGDYAVGEFYSMDAVTAAVLGGINMMGGSGELAGVLMAAMVITILNNILNLTAVSAYYQYALKGIVLIAIVLVFSLKDKKK